MQWVGLIGTLLLCVGIYTFYKIYKNTERAQRGKLLKIYALLAVLTVIIFAGIKLSGLPDKIFPQSIEQETIGEYKTWERD